MSTAQEFVDLNENLTDLHKQSLRIVALITAAAGYAWFIWGAWPGHNGLALPSTWLGIALLLACAVFSIVGRGRHLRAAACTLVWGIVGAVVCAALSFPSPAVACLFVLPVVLSSVLLDRRGVFLVAVVAGSLNVAINYRHMTPLRSVDVVLPTAVIVLVAVVSWLSMRNLYTALEWVWVGYERARNKEEAVREHQAELKRTLKALDEAAYRLERVNYMLTLARDQAREARRLKQQFAQTISHELRTPLNLIVGFVEVMAHSPEIYGSSLPPAYVRDLGIVYRNACHLRDLVNDVLDLARIEAAQMSLVLEKVSPAALVQEAVRTVRTLVEAHGLELHTQTEPDLPSLWCDATRIRQVMFNLISNAVRFTHKGRITISARRDRESVVFAVSDTGIGIAPEDIGRIFDEFQQVDGGTRRSHEGAGLGLAISKRFVELHKGRIGVESKVGQGSTFYFALPQDMAEDTLLEHQAVGLGGRAGKPGEEPILLAVTRSPSAATMLTRYISGFRTVAVPDLEQAKRVAQQLIPQVVVIDRTCQVLDPAQLAKLAQEWETQHGPLIACPLPGEEMLRERLDVDGYLVKPLSRSSLWDMLRPFGGNIEKVLVIDDDQDFVLLVGRWLEDSPVRRYQVVGAASGQEGLALMPHYRPDLVVLDLVLPDMDGAQVLAQIRADPEWKQVLVIVVSAQDEIDYQEPIEGPLVVVKRNGLMPGEVMRWVQSVASSAITLRPMPVAPRAAPVP
jgi:signal transduction histidine kinase/CheY-like chemotaxis protein